MRHGITVVLCGVTLYILLPALTRVFAAWPRLSTLAPAWLVLTFVTEICSFACMAALLALVLRTRELFPVATALLAGNAVTNVVPGGDAVGAGVQFRMLASSGIGVDRTAGGLAASSILNVAGLLALPIFAIPAMLGGVKISAGLVHAAYLGIGGFVLVAGFGVAAFTTNVVVAKLGAIVQWFLNRIPFRKKRTVDLPTRLLDERDLLRLELGRNWWEAILLVAGRVGFDYFSLLGALRAAGARPNPSVVLLAYAATTVIGLIPLTPGGIGIVEASLSGLLVLAGVPASRAVLATLAYRLGAYWLPIIAGAVSYVMFRRRYGRLRPSEVR